jgi:hypothetical protein
MVCRRDRPLGCEQLLDREGGLVIAAAMTTTASPGFATCASVIGFTKSTRVGSP